VHVRPTRSRNTRSNSYRILPTGPLVAIFQHSLPFLQSEIFQTHVGAIHRRAIGPLAHHNGTSAYSPSLTCHLPAPTIECLHRPPYKLTSSSRQSVALRIKTKLFKLSRTTAPKNLSLMYHTAVSIVMFLFKLLCDSNKSIDTSVSIVMQ
jgi:hypothetical protein